MTGRTRAPGLWRALRRLAPRVLAFLLACLLLPGPLSAAAASCVRAEGSWWDGFDSTEGISSADGVKVSGGRLEVTEGEPEDLGAAVPGEYAVYAVLATGFAGSKVYCGTGEKGHLVEYDPGELYQEGYGGVHHRGVSNSRGQAVVSPPQSRVTALAADGARYVYGCTSPHGHLFRFDAAAAGVLPEDLGAAPGGAALTSVAYLDTLVFAGSAAGNVLSYDPAAGTFADLGRPGGAVPVNSLVVSGGSLFVGSANGHLYRREGPGGFADVAFTSSGGITATAQAGGTLYLGTGDGRLFSWSEGALSELDQVSGTSVNALAASAGGELYAGAADGHLYVWSGGTLEDQGLPANGEGMPVNSLSLAPDGVLYGGTGNQDPASTGRLFRFNAGFEDHGTPGGGAHGIGDLVLRDHNLYAAVGPCLYIQSGESAYEQVAESPDGFAIATMYEESGWIYMGTDAGGLLLYRADASPAEQMTLLGTVPASQPVKAVLKRDQSVYVGCSDGNLYRYDLSNPGVFTLVNNFSGAVTALTWRKGEPGVLFVTTEAGDLYGLASGEWAGPRHSPDDSALRAVAVSDAGEVYCGSAGGRLYSLDGASLVERADCGQAVTRMAPATGGVAVGTGQGRLFFYDSALRDAGQAAASSVTSLARINQSVFLGLENGGVYCSDAGFIGDRGQVVEKQIAVFRAQYDPDRDLFYAGTYRNAHFLVIDPDTGTVVDRGRPVNGERELEDILVTGDGKVYGATYAGTHEVHNPDGGRLFRFEPEPGAGQPSFVDLGRPPEDDNWWISSLAEGADGTIYGGTSHVLRDDTHREGRLFSYTEAEGMRDLGVPVADQGVRCLTWHGDRLFGAGWEFGDYGKRKLFSYRPGSGFDPLGDAPAPPEGQTNTWVVRLLGVDGTIFCGQENGYLFSFDAGGEYEPRLLGKPVPDAAAVYGMFPGPAGTVLLGTGNNESQEYGHLVSYDPALGRFRDIGRLEAPGQKITHCVARSTEGRILCGTGVSSLNEVGWSEYGGHSFMLAPHRAGPEGLAESINVAPGLEELGQPVVGQEEVSALVALPGKPGTLVGGTSAPEGADARGFVYDLAGEGVTGSWEASGFRRVLSVCAGEDGSVYLGTGSDQDGPDARVLAFDPDDPGPPVDTGIRFAAGTKGVFALAWGGDGKLYAGTGDRRNGETWHPGGMYRCDPGAGTAEPVAEAPTLQGRVASLVAAGDFVYGGTGASPGETTGTAELICYSTSSSWPVTRSIGQSERTIAALAVMEGFVYLGTAPAGHVIRYDPSTREFEPVPWPFPAGSAVGCLAASDVALYGGAGDRGMLFRYEPEAGFTDLGTATGSSEGLASMTVDSLGKVYAGTAGDAALVRFDPSARFEWKTVNHTLDAPPGTEARVNVMGESGSPILLDAADGQDISLSSDGAAGLRLQAVLHTGDPSATPAVEEWGLTWNDLPGLDEVAPPRPEGAYPGEDIELWGSHFGELEGIVRVGGTSAEVVSWSEARVVVTVPGDIAQGEQSVELEDAGHTSAAPSRTVVVLSGPLLQRVLTPHSAGAYRGEEITLEGTRFGSERDGGSVTVGGAEAMVTSWRDDTVTARVPDVEPGLRPVVLRDGAGRETGPVDVSVLGAPRIDSIRPASGGPGDVVTLDGSWFLDSRESCSGSVRFTNAGVSDYVSWGNESIRVRVPAGALSGPVTLTVNGKTSNAVGFTVTGTPPPPTVRITSPAGDATVEGEVTVCADVTGEGVTAELWVDDRRIGTDTTSPFSFEWDSDDCPDGAHSLVVKAVDAWGRRAENDVLLAYTNHNVPGPSTRWHFAEGCTDYGFETWLLVQNPGDAPAVAEVRFLDETGKVSARRVSLPAGSRATINAEAVAGRASFAIDVSATAPVLCERSMYWGGRTEGHDSLGATSVSRFWYFAEGCTDYGFETFLLLSNPGAAPVVARVDYLYVDGRRKTVFRRLAPGTRVTVDASKDVGSGEFSIAVEAGAPGVVAERSMYHGGRRCGTGTMGSRAPSTTWFMAEGSTDWGFETWLLLLNPEDSDARVTACFHKDDGATVTRSYTVGAGSRFTVDMREAVGTADSSVRFTSDEPIVCERSMYWGGRTAGHSSIGSPAPGRLWHLAEGCADYGFETWVLIENPTDRPGVATLIFSTDDGREVTGRISLPANTRVSVDAADHVPASSFSTSVTADVPVVVERAVYWSGRCGGTGSVGAR